MNLKAVAISLSDANRFVGDGHRHHDPVHRDKFRVACELNGNIVGVAQVGRPVSRILDDGLTVEVVRLCTDGTKNACSFLYSRCARAAKELGFKHIVTYILDSETGKSLEAAGWILEKETKGQEWTRPSRRRETTAPSCDKQRWGKYLE